MEYIDGCFVNQSDVSAADVDILARIPAYDVLAQLQAKNHLLFTANAYRLCALM